MEKVYKSKVAGWYMWACAGMAIAFACSIYLSYKSTWILLIDVVFVGIGLWLMLDILCHTDYTINGDRLRIRCGVLYRMDMPIERITEITRKSTVLSSPALSAKRIGLGYGRKSWVYISPEQQEEFISDIKSINPDIVIR